MRIRRWMSAAGLLVLVAGCTPPAGAGAADVQAFLGDLFLQVLAAALL